MTQQADAFTLAAKWHEGQVRKGVHREPFVHHPLRVASLLIQHGIYEEAVLSAAMLHDVLEDSECPLEEIESAMGPEVLAWVSELTDRKDFLKLERKQMQVERAEMLSPQAKVIRLADKIDNVESLLRDPPTNWSWQRQRDYVAWADRVVRHLGPCHCALEATYRTVRDKVWSVVTGQTNT